MSDFIGYFTSRGVNRQTAITQYYPRPFRYLSSDCFRRGETHRKNFNFSFPVFNMEGDQTCVSESSDSDIKTLMASAAPESTKKSPKYAVNVFS